MGGGVEKRKGMVGVWMKKGGIDEVGKFYAKAYGDTVDFQGDKVAEIPRGDREQKLAFAREIAYFTWPVAWFLWQDLLQK